MVSSPYCFHDNKIVLEHLACLLTVSIHSISSYCTCSLLILLFAQAISCPACWSVETDLIIFNLGCYVGKMLNLWFFNKGQSVLRVL
jgi:hypothetical protein